MVTKEQILAALESTKLPCVRIVPEPDRTPGPTDSKFGGDYYLPVGTEASELEFLAQINFAQVPHLEGFPEKGLLQFFLHTEDERFESFIEDESVFLPDSGFFQIRWYPDVPQDGPSHSDVVFEKRWPMEKVIGGMKFEPAEEPATVAFGNEEDIIADLGFADAAKLVETLFLEASEDEDEDEDEDGEGYDLGDCSGVDGLIEDFGNWGIKLGGHPALRYDDFRLESEMFQAYSRLLFQFDLTPDSRDGDADTFCFFIRPEDLNACRFDDILLTWHNCY